jgi:hypothetical protein
MRHLKTPAAMAALALLPALAGAQTLQYRIDGTVNLTSPSTAGFPAELAGLTLGSPVTLLMTFDRGATSPGTSPIGTAPYIDATYYSMASATVTLLGGTAPIDLSQGTEGLWVFNDDVMFGSGPQDGLIMQNVAPAGTLGYLVSTGVLPTTTWADEAVPETTRNIGLVFGLTRLGVSGVFFRAQGFPLQVSVVPEPATWSLGLAGGALLLGLAAGRRRRAADQATSPPR